MPSELNIIKRRFERERLARKEAERILEQKSLELYETNQKLFNLNNELQTEVEARVKQLKFAEHEYQQLVESVNDLIFKTDLDGHFLYVNPKTIELTKYTESDFKNLKIHDLIAPNFKETVATFYNNQGEKKLNPEELEYVILTKNGTKIWVNQIASLVYNETKKTDEFIVVARDITEKKNINQILKSSEEKYRGIIENLELGLLEVNINELIIKAYPQFCEMTGYTENELLGKNAQQFLLHPDSVNVMQEQIRKRRNGISGVYEVQIKHKEGHYMWGMISGAPFYDIEGKQIGSIGIHLDISKQKKIENELQEAKEIAEASVKSKELFLANMSHEIRTPMNAIIGLGNLLKETNLTKNQYKYISTISTSSQNLLTIINDILDFTKIEAGKLEMESIPFDITYSIEKTIEVFEPIAKEKKLAFNYKIDKTLRREVLGDPTRLNQVLINLLGNAFKFTQKGAIDLAVELIDKTKTNYTVKFSVKDSGIGISTKNLETIFDSFTQAESSTARLYGGTGLGLAICHQLIKLMGGSLSVSSEIGIGTEFYFNVCFQILKTQTMIHNVPNITLAKHLKVLLVEDNQVNQFLAKTILNQWDCKIDCAENGKIAIEKVKETAYDIILMDIRMPIMNGEEATTIIRENLKISTPIIALTANAIKGDKEKYLALGMNGYISKPFSKESLKEVLFKWANQ